MARGSRTQRRQINRGSSRVHDPQTPVEALLERITSNTKIIAVSWVQYRTGAITDLEVLTKTAHARGIFVCADIIQGAGVQPFDFHEIGVDAACGGSHKWMCSPMGVGFLLLREEHIARLQPVCVGAMSYGTGEELSSATRELRSGINRFEPGAKNRLDIAALGRVQSASFSVTGISAIYKEAESIAGRLREGLRELGYPAAFRRRAARSLQFRTNKRSLAAQFHRRNRPPLYRKKRISFAKRPPGIRLSPHAFTQASEIDSVLKTLS